MDGDGALPRNEARKPSTSTGRAKTTKRLLSPNTTNTNPKKRKSLSLSSNSETFHSLNNTSNNLDIKDTDKNTENIESQNEEFKNDNNQTIDISSISDNSQHSISDLKIYDSLAEKKDKKCIKTCKRVVKNTKFVDFITNNEMEKMIGDDVVYCKKNTKKTAKSSKVKPHITPNVINKVEPRIITPNIINKIEPRIITPNVINKIESRIITPDVINKIEPHIITPDVINVVQTQDDNVNSEPLVITNCKTDFNNEIVSMPEKNSSSKKKKKLSDQHETDIITPSENINSLNSALDSSANVEQQIHSSANVEQQIQTNIVNKKKRKYGPLKRKRWYKKKVKRANKNKKSLNNLTAKKQSNPKINESASLVNSNNEQLINSTNEINSDNRNSFPNLSTEYNENKRSTRSSRNHLSTEIVIPSENNNYSVDNSIECRNYSKENSSDQDVQPFVLMKNDAVVEKLIREKLHILKSEKQNSSDTNLEICTGDTNTNNPENSDALKDNVKPFDPNVYDTTLLEIKSEEELYLEPHEIEIKTEELSPCSSNSDLSELFMPIRDCHIHLERLCIQSNAPKEVNVFNSFNKIIPSCRCTDEAVIRKKSRVDVVDSAQDNIIEDAQQNEQDSAPQKAKDSAQQNVKDSAQHNVTDSGQPQYNVKDSAQHNLKDAQFRVTESAQNKIIKSAQPNVIEDSQTGFIPISPSNTTLTKQIQDNSFVSVFVEASIVPEKIDTPVKYNESEIKSLVATSIIQPKDNKKKKPKISILNSHVPEVIEEVVKSYMIVSSEKEDATITENKTSTKNVNSVITSNKEEDEMEVDLKSSTLNSHVLDVIEKVVQSYMIESPEKEDSINTENKTSTKNVNSAIASNKEEDKMEEDLKSCTFTSLKTKIKLPVNLQEVSTENARSVILNEEESKMEENEMESPVKLKEMLSTTNAHLVIPKIKEDLKKSTSASSKNEMKTSRKPYTKLKRKHLVSEPPNSSGKKVEKLNSKTRTTSLYFEIDSPVKHDVELKKLTPPQKVQVLNLPELNIKTPSNLKKIPSFSSLKSINKPPHNVLSLPKQTIKISPKKMESSSSSIKSINITPQKVLSLPEQTIKTSSKKIESSSSSIKSINITPQKVLSLAEQKIKTSPQKIEPSSSSIKSINITPQKVLSLAEQKIKTSPQKIEPSSSPSKTPQKVQVSCLPRKLESTFENVKIKIDTSFASNENVNKLSCDNIKNGPCEKPENQVISGINKISEPANNKNIITKQSIAKLDTKSTDTFYNSSGESSSTTKNDIDLRQILSRKRTNEKFDLNKYKNIVIQTSKNSNRVLLKNPIISLNPGLNQTISNDLPTKTLKLSPAIQTQQPPINDNMFLSEANNSESKTIKSPKIKITGFGTTLIRSNSDTLSHYTPETEFSEIVTQKLNKIYNDQQQEKLTEARKNNFKGSAEKLFDENSVETLQVIIENDQSSISQNESNTEIPLPNETDIKKEQTENCKQKPVNDTPNLSQNKPDELVFTKPKHTFKFVEKCEVKRPPSRKPGKITINRPKLFDPIHQPSTSQNVFKAPPKKEIERKPNRIEPSNKFNNDDDVISILADTTALDSVFDVTSVRNEDSDIEDDFEENEIFMDKERFTQVKDWLSQTVDEPVTVTEPIVSPTKKSHEIPVARVNPGIQKSNSEEKSPSHESQNDERVTSEEKKYEDKKYERPIELEMFRHICFLKLKNDNCRRKKCHFAHSLPNNWQATLKSLPVDALMRTYKYVKDRRMVHFYKTLLMIVAEQLGFYKDFNNLTNLVKDVLELNMNTDREPLIKTIIQALIDNGFSYYSTVEIVFRSANVEQDLKNLLCDILLNLTVERRQLEDEWPIIQMLSVYKKYDIDKGIIQFIIIEALAKSYLQKDLVYKVYNDLIKKIPEFNMRTISATLCQKFIDLLRKYSLQSDADELFNRCISLNILEKPCKKIEAHRNIPKVTPPIHQEDTTNTCLTKETNVFDYPPPLIVNQYQQLQPDYSKPPPSHLQYQTKQENLFQPQQEHHSNQYQPQQEHSHKGLVQPKQETYLNRPPSHPQQEHHSNQYQPQQEHHSNQYQPQQEHSHKALVQPKQEPFLNRPPSHPQQEHHSNQYQLHQEHSNFPANQYQPPSDILQNQEQAKRTLNQYQLQQEHSNFPQTKYQPEQNSSTQLQQQQERLNLLQKQELAMRNQYQLQQKHQTIFTQNQYQPEQQKGSNQTQHQNQCNRSGYKKNPKNHPLLPGLRADKAIIDQQNYAQFVNHTQPIKSYTTGNQQNLDNKNYTSQPSTSSFVPPTQESSTQIATNKSQTKTVVDDFDRFSCYSTENLNLLANTATQNLMEIKRDADLNKSLSPNLKPYAYNFPAPDINKMADQNQSPVRVERQPHDDQSFAANLTANLASVVHSFSDVKQFVAEENYSSIMQLILNHKEGNSTDALLHHLINALIGTPHNYPTFFCNLSDMSAISNDINLNYMLKTLGVNLVLYLCENNQYDPAFRINHVLTTKYKLNDFYDIYNCKIYLKNKYSYFRRIIIIAQLYIVKGEIPIAWNMLRDGNYWQNNNDEADLKYRDFVLGKLFESFKKIKNSNIALDALLYLMEYKSTDANIREHANYILVNAINNRCNFDKIVKFMNISPEWYKYLDKNTIRAILVTAYFERKDCVSTLYEIVYNLRICPQLTGNEKIITLSGHYHYVELQLYLDRFFQNMMNFMPITEKIIINFTLNDELPNDEIPLLVHQYNSSKTVLANRVVHILENIMKPPIKVLNRNNCLSLDPESVNSHLLYRQPSSL